MKQWIRQLARELERALQGLLSPQPKLVPIRVRNEASPRRYR
ncbi:hypothetical protein [Crenobacter intestini]|nr:hypothetical protein [Crenobacter intestini]